MTEFLSFFLYNDNEEKIRCKIKSNTVFHKYSECIKSARFETSPLLFRFQSHTDSNDKEKVRMSKI